MGLNALSSMLALARRKQSTALLARLVHGPIARYSINIEKGVANLMNDCYLKRGEERSSVAQW